jgi:hypothetical protein
MLADLRVALTHANFSELRKGEVHGAVKVCIEPVQEAQERQLMALQRVLCLLCTAAVGLWSWRT